jgi:hypothetical protein
MPQTSYEVERQMFGKLAESRRKSYREYREALISGEVDMFPERVDCSSTGTSTGTSRVLNLTKSVGTISTRTSTTPMERAINRTRAEHQRNLKIKIENLRQLAQKQLDDVIEDMLPKYGLMLYPSHPCFTQEYPILADIQQRQNK